MIDRARAVRTAALLLLIFPGLRAAAHIEQAFACFVYIEPYEIRVEFVTTTSALGMPLDFGFDGIDQSERAALIEEAGSRLTQLFGLRADGKPITFQTKQIGFVTEDGETGKVVPDDRDLIPMIEARISGLFVYPRDRLPRSIEIESSIFESRLRRRYRENLSLPLTIELLTPPAERETIYAELTEEQPRYTWELPPEIFNPPLSEAPAPPAPSYTLLYAAGSIACVGVLLGLVPVGRARNRMSAAAMALAIGGGVGGYSAQRGYVTPVDTSQAEATFQSLLENVYHAFAHRDESRIFDTLATSVEGPLLETLYLDIQRGLRQAEDGGPSVRVMGVELLACEVESANSARLQARVRWVSSGTVSHWGHAHDRTNHYSAEVVAESVDERWKLTRVTILEEQRVR